jgi:hypothetical protein
VARPERTKRARPGLIAPSMIETSRGLHPSGDALGHYLMVDKPRGKTALLENGTLVFKSAALTGESKADRLPPGTLSKRFSQLGALDDKVTPAGRFTVSRDYDREYGSLPDIDEIQGRDWTISIHQVYLGTPSERRADRLESPDHQDAPLISATDMLVPPTRLSSQIRDMDQELRHIRKPVNEGPFTLPVD